MSSYELCVIGSGPGGQKAAIQAAKLGRRTVVVERMESVGGVAIHTGTIPSKAFREAVVRTTHGADPLAIRGEVSSGLITIEELLASCQRIVATEIEVVRRQLARNGVDMVQGHARFVEEGTVEVTSSRSVKRVIADKFVIAVGSEPARPSNIPFDGERIITSDELLQLRRLPRSMIVVGGGVIGTEYASMFAQLGVRVTLVEKGERLLGFLDQQIGEALQYHLREKDMTLRFGEQLDSVRLIEPADDDDAGRHGLVEAVLTSGATIHAEALLFCLGRQGATRDLGLDVIGLTPDARGRLKVDETFRTVHPDVYAVGDVIGFPSLASASMDQGRAAASALFDGPVVSTPQLFPIGIYSIPEISVVGQSEEQLTTLGIPFESGMARYREIARGQLLGDHVGMLKLLFHQKTREILGVHVLGTGATELIHIGQAVMALGGTMDYFANTPFNYPTLAECYKVAALDGLNKLG